MAFDIISEFTKGLLNEAGFSSLAPQELKDYEEKIMALVSQKLGMETIKLLPEKDLDDYFDLVEKNADPQEVYDFLAARISNLDQSVIEILKGFRGDFLKSVSQSDSFDQTV